MNTTSAEPRYSRTRLLWLLLSVPLAVVIAWWPFVYSAINLCGISGCSGGGYGVSYGPVGVSLALDVLIGLIFFLAVALPPWGRWRTRILVGAIVGLVIAGYLIVGQLMSRYQGW